MIQKHFKREISNSLREDQGRLPRAGMSKQVPGSGSSKCGSVSKWNIRIGLQSFRYFAVAEDGRRVRCGAKLKEGGATRSFAYQAQQLVKYAMN